MNQHIPLVSFIAALQLAFAQAPAQPPPQPPPLEISRITADRPVAGQPHKATMTAKTGDFRKQCPEVWIRLRMPNAQPAKAGIDSVQARRLVFAAQVGEGSDGLYDVFCSSGAPGAQATALTAYRIISPAAQERQVASETLTEMRSLRSSLAAANKRIGELAKGQQAFQQEVKGIAEKSAAEIAGLSQRLDQARQDLGREITAVGDETRQLRQQTQNLAASSSSLTDSVRQLREAQARFEQKQDESLGLDHQSGRVLATNSRALAEMGERKTGGFLGFFRKHVLRQETRQSLTAGANKLETMAKW